MKNVIHTMFAAATFFTLSSTLSSTAVILTQPIDMNNNNMVNVSNVVSSGGTQSGSGQNMIALGCNSGLRENNGDGSVNIGFNAGRNRAYRGCANIGLNNGGYNDANAYGSFNIAYLGAGGTNFTGGEGAINIGYNLGYRSAGGQGSLTAGFTSSGQQNSAGGRASWAVGNNVNANAEYAYVFGQSISSKRDNSLSCMHLDVNGTPYCAGFSQFQNPSDQRLKQDVKPVEHALDTILKLRGVEYRYTETAVKEQGLPSNARMGFIAQEAEKVMPSWVSEMPNGYKGISINGFEALSVEATRELKATVDVQQKEIEQLRKDIAELKKILSK